MISSEHPVVVLIITLFMNVLDVWLACCILNIITEVFENSFAFQLKGIQSTQYRCKCKVHCNHISYLVCILIYAIHTPGRRHYAHTMLGLVKRVFWLQMQNMSGNIHQYVKIYSISWFQMFNILSEIYKLIWWWLSVMPKLCPWISV